MKKQIILISGKMRSGKDTFADMLANELRENSERFSFAESLKEASAVDFAGLIEDINACLIKFIEEIFTDKYISNDEEIKQRIYEYVNSLLLKDLYTKDTSQWFNEKNLITRRILQIYGTDIVKQRFGKENYWVSLCWEKIKKSNKNIFIISDWRFKHEYNNILECINDEYDLKTVRVKSNRINENLVGSDHISEIDLDDFDFDYYIDNSGTLEDLIIKAKEYSIIIGKK